MLLEWVNHASFILASGPIRLLCDPWLEGTSFNNGWKLLSPTKFTYSDFSKISHIWFSHEHPDHFSPSNLKKIPEQLRRAITVLFHCTKDQRVLDFCKSLGFSTRELPCNDPVELAPGFTIRCGKAGLVDSWLYICAEGKALLNMNDCVFDHTREFRSIQGTVGRVDILLSQFSYANWIGNPGDLASHHRHAQRKRAEIATQVRVFKPAQFIPSASYVYFCHAENVFMNASMNRIRDIAHFVQQDLHVDTIVLYPADVWEVGASRDSSNAIAAYEADFARIQSSPPMTSPTYDISTLKEAASAFVTKCVERNNPFLLRALPAPVIHVTDLDSILEFSYRAGLVEAPNKHPDLRMSSDALLYSITYDCGGDTLISNGRYEVPAGGHPQRFFRMLRVPTHNSYGNTFDFEFLGHQAVDKLRSVIPG